MTRVVVRHNRAVARTPDRTRSNAIPRPAQYTAASSVATEGRVQSVAATAPPAAPASPSSSATGSGIVNVGASATKGAGAHSATSVDSSTGITASSHSPIQ